MPSQLKSRKFWMAVGACCVSLGGVLTGAVEPTVGIGAVVATVMAYLAAEAHIDAKGASVVPPGALYVPPESRN